ncbi:unnamed protein product, partial [Ectocarpus fasciculatus]
PHVPYPASVKAWPSKDAACIHHVSIREYCGCIHIVALFWGRCVRTLCPTQAKAQARRAGRCASCTSSSLNRWREEYAAPLAMNAEEEQERANE